ncbi:hypothetical protein [Paenibacillus terrae]|uniref:hypothetical protein n=1 Tax=Paenibacillus terrae TaxID=159743 RepID=UPI00207B1019|nr:hypothetical protein [Paenibacillus terrae]
MQSDRSLANAQILAEIQVVMVYKNIVILNGKNSAMNGVVVYNGVDYFVPQQAVDLIQ